jgi:hypothetical protein
MTRAKNISDVKRTNVMDGNVNGKKKVLISGVRLVKHLEFLVFVLIFRLKFIYFLF